MLAAFLTVLAPDMQRGGESNLGVLQVRSGTTWSDNSFQNWRDQTRKPSFRFNSSGSFDGAIAVVWSGGASPYPAGKGGEPTPNTGRGIGVPVDMVPLDSISNGREFSVDFARFAPSLKWGTPSSWTFGSRSRQPLAQKIIEDIDKNRRKQHDANYELVTTGKKPAYFIQILSTQGASEPVRVLYGEPDPGAGSTQLEVQTIAKTSEFPDAWGKAWTPNMESHAQAALRWSTSSKPIKIMMQARTLPYSKEWAIWDHPKGDLARQFVDGATGGQGVFYLPLKNLPKPSSKAQIVYVRIVPMTAENNLAGLPSNEITITIPAQKIVMQPLPAGKLTFTTEIIGLEPGYFGGDRDEYRFVLTKTPPGDMKKHFAKLIGKSNPGAGDKVWLPPMAPEDKSWWEKFKDTVAAIISKIDTWFTTIVSVFQTVILAAPGALAQGIAQMAKWAGANETAVDTAVKGLDKALSLSAYPHEYSRKVTGAADAITDGILDKMGADAKMREEYRPKIKNHIISWAKNRTWMNEAKPEWFLAPDEDYIVRPPTLWIKTTAKAEGQVAPGFRQTPPSVTFKVGVQAKDASTIGTQAEYSDLYQKTFTQPSLEAGQVRITPVVLDYHPFHKSNNAKWRWAHNHVQATLYFLDGKSTVGQSVNMRWGKTAP